jgi:cytochrome c oxidase subunit 2
MQKQSLLILLFLFIALEGVAWFAYTYSQKKDVQNTQVAMPSSEQSKNVDTPLQTSSSPDEPVTIDEKVIHDTKDVKKTEHASNATVKEFAMTGRQYAWEPSIIKVKQGNRVKLHVKSEDVLHGIVIPELGIDNTDIPAGETRTIEFMASKKGRFEFLCSTFCGDRHIDMTGVIIVE